MAIEWLVKGKVAANIEERIMTIQEAIQRLVNIARNSVEGNRSGSDEIKDTIAACEKLEEIFRLKGGSND